MEKPWWDTELYDDVIRVLARILFMHTANTCCCAVSRGLDGMILVNCQKQPFFLNKREEKWHF
jgi:hypothetical protein